MKIRSSYPLEDDKSANKVVNLLENYIEEAESILDTLASIKTKKLIKIAYGESYTEIYKPMLLSINKISVGVTEMKNILDDIL